MDNNVVRQAGENQLSRQVGSCLNFRSSKIPKKERMLAGVVEGVGFLHRMRIKLQQAAIRARGGCVIWPPSNLAAESQLEATDRIHDHGVHHLLMKLRVR